MQNQITDIGNYRGCNNITNLMAPIPFANRRMESAKDK